MKTVANSLFCKLQYGAAVPSMVTSAWVVVMISIERAACVKFPFKIHLFADKFAKYGIPAVFIIFGSLAVPTYLAYDYSNGLCVGHTDYVNVFYILVTSYGILYSFVPLNLQNI